MGPRFVHKHQCNHMCNATGPYPLACFIQRRRGTMQRSQAAFSDGHASLPAPGPLTDAAAIRSVHHPAPTSRRSGAGRQEFYLTGLSILATTTTNAFFSRALRKASRAQQRHKTRRLIRPHPPNPRRAASHTNSPPPPGKPAGANGHTRRTASFHTPPGTCRPKGG